MRPRCLDVCLFLFFAACLVLPVQAQLAERPGLSDDTSAGPKDLSGRSIKTPRVRVVHTTDPALEGGSMHLQVYDPFLAFKMGKDITQREFRSRDGVFGDNETSRFRGKLSDGVTPAIVGNDQVSCAGCHNIPYGDAGGGTNFAKQSGKGRNAPHFYGSGILEMLAWQIRLKMMQQMDTNRNNVVDRDEMNADPVRVSPAPDAPGIYFGSSGDNDDDGWPDINNIFRVWFVGADGKVIENTDLSNPDVAGYSFILEVFGWGERRFGLNTTNRIFVWDPFLAHGGLEAYDPTTAFDPDGDGWSQVSNAGFHQTWIGHVPPDLGNTLNSVGLSVDDPDGDGFINEISEGDLDMAEWYLLNSPRPGMGRQTPQTERGKVLFSSWGCDRCHVQNWLIEAADPDNPDIHQRYLGDLRFFDLDVEYNAATGELEGNLESLYDEGPNGEAVRRRGAFLVEGIGTDFRHHKMGPELSDLQYDGAVEDNLRTGPLWGNGASGFPWNHDGQAMTLDQAVRRHAGQARSSRDAYVAASLEEQEAVLAWLRSHVLYQTDTIPVDLDGDGAVVSDGDPASKWFGNERFNPEWLFKTPGVIEGKVLNPQGKRVTSKALRNVRDAYGLDLPYLVDSDLDGFADVQDECPTTTGYHDGCN